MEHTSDASSSRSLGQDCVLATPEASPDDEQSLMQTSNRAAPDFDRILIYAFASVDPFFVDNIDAQVRIETYCHRWTEREGPMRNRLPIILNRNSPAIGHIAARWTHLVPLPWEEEEVLPHMSLSLIMIVSKYCLCYMTILVTIESSQELHLLTVKEAFRR